MFANAPGFAGQQEESGLHDILGKREVVRAKGARERRQANGVAATTFFHDPAGRPWKDADAFRDFRPAVGPR